MMRHAQVTILPPSPFLTRGMGRLAAFAGAPT